MPESAPGADLFALNGKVAVVTGSTRGIGKSIAEVFARSGARVVISSRKKEQCEAVAGELIAKGYEALSVPCNVSRTEELQTLVRETMAQWGRIDILILNAATNPAYGPSSEMKEEIFDKIMNTNVKANFLLCNMVLPQMAERKDGAVIIISSIAAIRGTPVLGAYAISKAAEAQMARNLAVEWGKHNIRVNTLAPGLVKTDFAKALWDNPTLLKEFEKSTPLGRIGEPEDIAGVALCLASAAGRYVTGQYIVVDGGVTIAGNV